MAQKDYYSILGVTKSATADEIKKAYRKKALEFHPDRNKDKGAADKFKEVNSAYEVLSNPQKRQTYDQYGEAAFQNGGGRPGAGGPFQYTYSTNAQDFSDFFGGADPFEDIFSTFFGGAQRRAQMPHYSMTITFKEAMEGAQKNITHDNKKQTINVPKGTEDGTTIRYQTFQVTFRVKPSDTFQRDGQDLYVDVSLPFTLFLLGGDIKVPTLEGSITIKVRPQTEPNGMLRLSGRGAPYINSNHRGDLYIRLKPKMPNKLTREQKSLLNDLKETGI